MRKLLAIFMSVCLLCAATVPAFAVSSDKEVPPDLVASETRKITSAKNDRYEVYSVIDTEGKTAQAVRKDLITGEYVYGPKVPFAQRDAAEYVREPAMRAPDYSITHQDTFLNYEYDIYTNQNPIEWSLQRPDFAIFSQYYFMVYENSSNLRYLEYYQDDVNALNDQEWVTIGYVGMAVFETLEALIDSHAAISTYGVLSGEAAVSIIEAIDAGITAAGEIETLIDYYNDCSGSYRNVLNRTDNIHY